MMYLVTSPLILPDPPNEGRTVFVSEPASYGASGMEYECLPPMWNDFHGRMEVQKYLIETFYRLSRKIYNKLNEIHHLESCPPVFWDIVISYWLVNYLHTLYARREHLLEGLRRYGRENVVLVASDMAFPKYDSAWEFFDLTAVNPVTLSAFYAAVAKDMGIAVHKVFRANEPKDYRGHNPNREFDFTVDYLCYVAKRAKDKVRDKLFGLLIPQGNKTAADVLMLSHYWSRRDIFWLSRSVRLAQFEASHHSARIEEVDRMQLLNIPANDEFEQLAIRLLPQMFPVDYLEKFKSYLAEGEKYSNHSIYFTDFLTTSSEVVYSLSAALGKRKGAKIISGQSSGGIGQYSNDALLQIERGVADCFITSGWIEPSSGGATAPYSFPYLNNYFNKHRCGGSEVIWAGTAAFAHTVRITEFPFMGDYIPAYLGDKKIFMDSLGADVRSRMIYRPYRVDFSCNAERAIFKKYPEVRIENRYILKDLLVNAKMFVSDHQGTSMLYAFLVNVPTILYWRRDPGLEIDSSKPTFDLLRDAGILHHDPASAARKINAVWANPESWWDDPATQKARMQFVNRYCRPNPRWKEDYVGLFRQILDSAKVGAR